MRRNFSESTTPPVLAKNFVIRMLTRDQSAAVNLVCVSANILAAYLGNGMT